MWQHSWLDRVCGIFPSFFLLVKGVLESSRAEYQTMSWCVSAWLLLLLLLVLVLVLVPPLCVFDQCHYQPLSSGERHPLQDLPYCLFTSPLVSLSCYPLRLLLCVWGLSLLTLLVGKRTCISALHICSSLSFSPPGFGAFGQSDGLIYPLPDIKSVGKQHKE